jgi:high-affinity iron transporter
VLPGGDPLWDTSWLLDDHGGLGGFLAGLVGYRSRPNGLEILAYLVYVTGAALLFFPALLEGRGSAAKTAHSSRA